MFGYYEGAGTPYSQPIVIYKPPEPEQEPEQNYLPQQEMQEEPEEPEYIPPPPRSKKRMLPGAALLKRIERQNRDRKEKEIDLKIIEQSVRNLLKNF